MCARPPSPAVLCRHRGEFATPATPRYADQGGKCCARRLRRTVDRLLKASARDERARRGQDPAMSSRQIVAGSLALSVLMSSPALTWRANGQAAPPVPAGAQAPAESGESAEVTPPRVSYIYGEVSFWRPGAEDWAPARVNTPLAPGDVLYSGSGGNVEIQVGPRAFVRAAEATQIGLDNQEPDFLQLRVTGGHAALDVRELAAGHTVELGTPNAVFTVERTGFYRVGVGPDSTTFTTYRGGMATMTAAGGAPTQIAANQQVVITGTEASRVETDAAPQLTAWDRWNYERTNYLLQSTSIRNLPPAVYGAEALEQHGSWRTVETYGAVWVPASVSPGWVPYSAGRWIWDPRFGWTWLDDAPWGWAPYHYGRWVFVGSYWAWAPGPVIVRPVYSPALVVFLGGGGGVGMRGPLDVKPVAASVTVAAGSAPKPPVAMQRRAVVATRPPHDPTSRLGAEGLATGRAAEPTPAPRIVPSPRSARGTDHPTVSNGGPRQDRHGGGGAAGARPGRGAAPGPGRSPRGPRRGRRRGPPPPRGVRRGGPAGRAGGGRGRRRGGAPPRLRLRSAASAAASRRPRRRRHR